MLCCIFFLFFLFFVFFQAEDGIRYLVRSRGLGDVYKRQPLVGGDDVLEAGDAPGGGLELVERLGPGVALVAQHHARPLAG